MADKKKMGLTLHMTGARWFMVGFGVLGLMGTVVYVLVRNHASGQDSGASVTVQAPAAMNNAPGKSTAAYAAEVQKYNQRNAQAAENQGKSFVGIPVTSITHSNLQTTLAQPKAKTTTEQQIAQEQKAIDAENQSHNAQQAAYRQGPQNNKLDSEINLISKAFIAPQAAPQLVPVREYVTPDSRGKNVNWGSADATAPTVSKAPAYMVPVTGDIIYAVMDDTAKSSITGAPVMGTLLQAPFLKEKVLGKFTKPSGSNYLMIRFTTLVLPDGQTVGIDAYAVAPKTTLPAMATSVNTHFFARAGALLGEAFLAGVQGYGQAVAQQGQMVSQGFGGSYVTYPLLTPAQTMDIAIGKAAAGLQPLSSALNKTFTQPNTVTVGVGTPFDLFVAKGGKA
jgi:type IV secretory pathway VirB10-like protein